MSTYKGNVCAVRDGHHVLGIVFFRFPKDPKR